MTFSKPLGGILKLINAILVLIVLVIGCVGWVFWPTKGRVYDLTAQDVRAGLRQMTTPKSFTGPKLRLIDEPADRMNWALEQPGGLSVIVSATLSAENEGKATRVLVSIGSPPLGPSGPGAIRKAAIQKLLLSTLIEQIDATLTQREFAWVKVAPEMFLTMAVNLAVILEQKDRVAEASATRERRNIDRAYEAEARGEAPGNSR